MKTEQIVILVVAFFLGMLLLNVVKNVCGCELEEGFQFYNNPQNPTRPDIWENLRKENRICKNDSGEILGKSIR